jgi:hypothetical protein
MEYSRERTAGDLAQGQSGRSGIGAESVYQAARELDSKGHFGIADRNRVFELLSLIEVAIGLASGDRTGPGKVLGSLGQGLVFSEQGASQVEPLGFPDIAGAGHMSYKYACL